MTCRTCNDTGWSDWSGLDGCNRKPCTDCKAGAKAKYDPNRLTIWPIILGSLVVVVTFLFLFLNL